MKTVLWSAWRSAGAALVVVTLIAAGGCGGSSSGLSGSPASQSAGSAPAAFVPPGPQVSSAGAGKGTYPVLVRPQAEVELGIKGVSFEDPRSLLARLPKPQHAAAAFTEADLLKDASSFEAALPKQNISEPGTPLATFNAKFEYASPALADLAYTTYDMYLQGYPGDRPQTVEFTWDSPPADGTGYFVGFSNYADNTWDWYAGPDDTVLTIPSLADYQDPSGHALVMVVVTDNKDCTLRRLRVGALELRGTGLESDNNLGSDTGGAPPLLGGTLPSSVDLRPGLGPIRNQGQLGSCLTFASADGAYNYLLHKIYGNAWSLSDNKFCMSPKWLYQHTGECSSVGRWTEVFDYLQNNGVATWKNAPYDGACGNTWNEPECNADAAVLKISSWREVDCKNQSGIDNLKNILAFEDKPVVFGMWLDQTFMSYTGGTWNWVGPFDQSMGHAMLICGYDDAKQAFLVRNSWGLDWGENGYVWIGYNTFKNPNVQMHSFTISEDFDNAVKARFLGGSGNEFGPPSGVSASDGTQTTFVRVTWSAVSGATGYEIFRDSVTGAAIGTVGGSTLQYDDSSLDPGDGNSHNYWVRAVKNAQKSEFSSPDIGYLGNNNNLAPQITGVFYYGNFAPGQQIQVWAEGSGADPMTFDWDFGGGASPNTSSDPAPIITLGGAGDYSGSLTVTNGDGSDTFNFDYSLGGGSGGPTADLTADMNSAPQGSDILFDASGSTDDGVITTYLWEFTGDAEFDYNSGSSPYLSLNFPNPGDYTVYVTVVDNDGLYATASYAVTITAGGGNSPPSAWLDADIFSGFATLTVNFDASLSSDPDADIAEYQWDFEGDGIIDFSTGTDPFMTVNYPFAGVYYPTVYVIDSQSAYDFDYVTVTVF